METVKTLLKSTKENLKMQLWWAEEHDREPQFIEDIPILQQKIVEIDRALLALFSVSQQRELLVSFAKYLVKLDSYDLEDYVENDVDNFIANL